VTPPPAPQPEPDTEPTRRPAPHAGDRRFVAHARTVMALTLLSRLTGLVRDAVCSRAFGASPVWSAFVTAFIVPNLFRRLFGEGALSAAFIPEYARLSRDDPPAARALASLTVAAVGAALGVITLAAELALLAVLGGGGATGHTRTVVVLAMIMLPFAPLVCLGAIFGGMLQTHGRFAPHAAAPVILNLCMASAAWIGAVRLGWPLERAAVAVAGAVVLAGLVQTAWFLRALRAHRPWTRSLGVARGPFRTMLRRLAPALIGMGALQLGTAIDGLLAGWPVMVGPTLPGGGAYPMDESAASVLFFAARLYQFPLGVFGIAIATAVFPALARDWGNRASFDATLARGVRTSLFISLPATVGLVLVAEPLARVIYGGGNFGVDDAERVTAALRAYAPAIWAYSLTHVLTRAFYASGDTRTPMLVGVGAVALNLALDVTLMFPLAERGLAWGTSIASVAQALTLSWLAHRRLASSAPGRGLLVSVGLSVACSGAMAGAILAARWAWTPDGAGGWTASMLVLARDVGTGGLAYLALAPLLRRPEPRWLLQRAGGDGGRTTP
jgi:putative peptidoglycan lipid II flippase